MATWLHKQLLLLMAQAGEKTKDTKICKLKAVLASWSPIQPYDTCVVRGVSVVF